MGSSGGAISIDPGAVHEVTRTLSRYASVMRSGRRTASVALPGGAGVPELVSALFAVQHETATAAADRAGVVADQLSEVVEAAHRADDPDRPWG